MDENEPRVVVTPINSQDHYCEKVLWPPDLARKWLWKAPGSTLHQPVLG